MANTKYNRQSSFANGDVIDADFLNNEYDAIELAFEVDTGHKHDGTYGSFTNLIADDTGVTRIAVDDSISEEHKIKFYLDDALVLEWNQLTPNNLLQTDRITHVNIQLDDHLDSVDNAITALQDTVGSSFKGEWSSLTGALELPSVVTHNGLLWELLQNIPDVTLEEPGTSDKWFQKDNTAKKTSNRFLHFYRSR